MPESGMVAAALLIALSNDSGPLPLIPYPKSVQRQEGTLTLPSTLVIGAADEFRRQAQLLADSLRAQGIRAKVEKGEKGAIVFLPAKAMGKEQYSLSVDGKQAVIRAATTAGAFYGAQTLKQLSSDRKVPQVKIEDEPRFEWRGLHLDVSRHFFSKAEILKYLDYLADLKLNTFHWHLIDDGGWRMEVGKYPKLTEIGAWRTQRPGEVWNYGNLEFPGKKAGKPLYGGFYTQKQIQEVVAYAADRGITVVPEIEMPGHCQPAIIAYPETTCNVPKEPGRAYRTTAYCPGKEKTFEFLMDVLDETMELFPSKVIHIGGDEVDKYDWARCPDCQQRMRSEGLKNVEELQSYFVKRIEDYLNSEGRTLMGWDEILEGGLAPNAMVMSWRGTAGGIAAAKAGRPVVMSPTSHCYFDYSYTSIPTEKAYAFDPVPVELGPEEAKRVLGGQANVWTEWMSDFAKVEEMIFPRIFAMAESLWTPKDQKDWDGFSDRIESVLPRLVHQKVNFFVEPPTAETALIVFDEEAEVSFRGSRVPGVELRYTLDGTPPNANSPIVRGPIKVSRDAVVTAAYVRDGKPLPGSAKVACRRALKAVVPVPLTLETYLGTFSKLPEFNKIKSENLETVSAFDIRPLMIAESFAARWRGTIRIPRDGDYTFTVGSDDGSALWIDGAMIVDGNQPQAYTERSGKARLKAGVFLFEIGYFQQGGAARFGAFVEGPGLEKTDLTSLVVAPGK